MVVHLATYESGPFTDREKAALRLAECLALAPHQMDETFYDMLCEHFTPAQIVHLGVTIAFLYGFGRFVAAFRIPLKEESQDWSGS